MIKYALVCENMHNWDAWFASIAGYDDQYDRGLVGCPFCESKHVGKAPMAPSIVTTKSLRSDSATSAPAPVDTASPTSPDSFSLAIPEPIKAMFAEMKERITKTHDYVGNSFAREVRAIHDGEAEERPIYGEATARDVQALLEDEIPVLPLPNILNPKGKTHLN